MASSVPGASATAVVPAPSSSADVRSSNPPESALVRQLHDDNRELRVDVKALHDHQVELKKVVDTVLELQQQRSLQEEWVKDLVKVLSNETKSQFPDVKFFESWCPNEEDKFRHDAQAIGSSEFMAKLRAKRHIDVSDLVFTVLHGRLQATVSNTIVRLRSKLATALRAAAFADLLGEPDGPDPQNLPLHARFERACVEMAEKPSWRRLCVEQVRKRPDWAQVDTTFEAARRYASTAAVLALHKLKWSRQPTNSDLAFSAYVIEALFEAVNLQQPGGVSHFGDYYSWFNRTRTPGPSVFDELGQ
eukprot:TRINITY_DN148_c0_g1_i4.p1 TRINITY_DN148_c0_g1~~TRINITY_DN148_c0_g1_i4.p1  ORF type:complete len:304 (+),score=58.90 TRINITY_DN148_c0_g1_i4:600-1511(+)